MSTTKPVYLSKKGMKELKKHIARLERDKQQAMRKLRELDKSSSREERLIHIEQLGSIEAIDSELADKRLLLESAVLLPRKRDALRVAIGSVVDLLDTNGRVIRYMLVDSIEADPSSGRISIKSPLGQNLLGKQIQDVVEWTANIGTGRLQLVGIG